MKDKLVILGAGGHGRVARDVALLCGYKTVVFLDDAERDDVETAGKTSEYGKFVDEYDFFVALGDNKIRERITDTLVSGKANVVSLIHPSAILGMDVKIGNGTIVMAGAVVNTGAVLGNGVIVNTASSVDHDNVLDDFCHVAVGVHLAGTVKIGKCAFVGAGSVVVNNISICSDAIIGAGAVVVKDINEKGTYVGVPAVKIKD